jgi:hypothetical protein
MPENPMDCLIAGEPAGALATAIVLSKPDLLDRAGINPSHEVRRDVHASLMRALMRVEAELMLCDADLVGAEPAAIKRTRAQRRRDAFDVLVERVTDLVLA